MNWTEGGLARHSRASKSRAVLLRQKEHFATARSGLFNANVKISPPVISFLAQPANPSSPARHHPSKSKYKSNTSRCSSSSKKRARGNSSPHSSHYFQDDAGLKLPTPANIQRDQAEAEAFRQKRRKLLLTGDWTGVDLQKPIDIEFSRTRESLNDPWGHSKLRHVRSSKGRLRQMLSIKHTAAGNRAQEAAVKRSRPLSPSQLRVRVGSRERALGGSSNAGSRNRTCRDVESSPRDAHVPRPKHSEGQRRRKNMRNSAMLTTMQTAESPELHQPVPRRPFLPSLLRSESSGPDHAASTKARVGVLLPAVPSSQLEQNEAWWTFVGGAELASELQRSLDQKSSQREISPGVSQPGLSLGSVEIGQGPPHVDGTTSMIYKSSAQASPLQLDQPEDAIRGDVHLGNDDVSSSRQPNTSSLGSSPPRPFEFEGFEEDVVPGMEYDKSKKSDIMSQAAFPASLSPITEELQTSSCNWTNIPGGIDNPTVQPTLSIGPPQSGQPARLIRPEQPWEDSFTVEHQQTEKSQETDSKFCNTGEDDSNTWMEFVFGELDEGNLEAAFLEASKDLARNLCPSDPSTSIVEDVTSEAVYLYPEPSSMAFSTSSVPGIDGRDFADEHDSKSSDITATSSNSNRATLGVSSPDPFGDFNSPNIAPHRHSYPNDVIATDMESNRAISGGSSPDPLSRLNLAHPDTAALIDTATVGSFTKSNAVSVDTEEEFMRRSDAWSLVMGDNDNASLVTHSPFSHEDSEVDTFRFARPKPFTGKNITFDEQRQIALSAAQVRGKRVSRRRQSRVGDGRARIRSLPNFNGDPIEEVEECEKSFSAKNVPHSSLFSSLDIEGGF